VLDAVPNGSNVIRAINGRPLTPFRRKRFFPARTWEIAKRILGKKKSAGHQQRHWERGRRRTRQDQISLGLKDRRWNCGARRSAPNEENLFLLPDRFRTVRNVDPAVWPDVSPTPSFVDQSRPI